MMPDTTPDDEPFPPLGSDEASEPLPSGDEAGPVAPFGDFAIPQPPEAVEAWSAPAEAKLELPAGAIPADTPSAAVLVPGDELIAANSEPLPSHGDSNASREPHPIPGGKGRLIDVGFRPRGDIRVVPGGPSLPIAEQQPGLQLPYDVARDMVYRPGQDGIGAVEQLPDRPQDPRVFPPAVKLAGAVSQEPTPEELKAVPRLVVMVSLANARALFDDALERAADKMAPRFQNLSKFEIEQHAFRRKSAERAVNPWMHGPAP